MTVKTFRELLTQRPFRPFRLVMSSGQAYDVRHPEMAMLTRTDILVGVGDTDEGVPAEFRICSAAACHLHRAAEPRRHGIELGVPGRRSPPLLKRLRWAGPQRSCRSPQRFLASRR